MAYSGLEQGSCAFRRWISCLVPCFGLLLILSDLGTSLYFESVDSETVFYCPGDLDTYKVDLNNTYKGFTYSINTVYISSAGYLTDTYRPNLVAPEKFPKYSGTNLTVDCVGDRCWIDYYYTASEVADIEAKNFTEDCVNGRELTMTFDVYDTFEDDYIAYERTLTPDGCESSPVVEAIVDYNWMIAGYWQNLETRYFESLMWVRQTNDSTILTQASNAITALDYVSTFTATAAAIFTWDEVSYELGFQWGYPIIHFQIALVTDGEETFIMYNFKNLSFSAGQAGFDAGDMLNYCGLHYSRSNESMVWAQTSNVGITGTWVMKFGEGFDKSICEPLRADVPYCICDDGWEGRICAASIDDCVNHNCPANSECVDGHMSFTCNYCAGVTCENEGVCVSNANTQSYTCNCVGNHTGVHCEQCLTLTCENGGVCSNNATSGENTCTCAEGYSGSTCQNSLQNPGETKTNDGLSGGEIAGIVVGALLGLILLTLLIILLVKRLKKKEEVEPSRPTTSRNMATASHA